LFAVVLTCPLYKHTPHSDTKYTCPRDQSRDAGARSHGYRRVTVIHTDLTSTERRRGSFVSS